jgi:hypothetical protein
LFCFRFCLVKLNHTFRLSASEVKKEPKNEEGGGESGLVDGEMSNPSILPTESNEGDADGIGL